MKDRLNKELENVLFEGKNEVLSKIRLEEYRPSWLSKFLNYEIMIPVPVLAIALSICLFVTVKVNDRISIENDVIYVINEGGHYEIY